MVKFHVRELSDSKRCFRVAEGETSIGRGIFLGVADKRVSRNHGILKPVENGLEIKSIHINPCFYTRKSEPEKWLKLGKDEAAILEPGDTFSLLPKQYIYKIVSGEYKEEEAEEPESDVGGKQKEETVGNAMNDEIKNNRGDTLKEEATVPKTLDKTPEKKFQKVFPQKLKTSNALSGNENVVEDQGPRSQSKVTIRTSSGSTFNGDGKEVALPSAKKRKLPSWMTDCKKFAENSSKMSESPAKMTKQTQKQKVTQSGDTPKSSNSKREKEMPKLTFDSDSDENGASMQVVEPARSVVSGFVEMVDVSVTVHVNEDSGGPKKVDIGMNDARKIADIEDKNVQMPKPETVKATECKKGSAEVDNGMNDSMKHVQTGDEGAQIPKTENAEADQDAYRKDARISHPTSDAGEATINSQNSLAAGPRPDATAAQAIPRSPCAYGSSCYRKNPAHQQEFSHPGDTGYIPAESDDESGTRPECPYGTSCYRKNPLHKKKFNHTRRVSAKRAAKMKDARKDESSEDDYDYDDSFLNDDSDDDLDAGASDEDSDWNPSQSSQPNKRITSLRVRQRKATVYRESDSDASTEDEEDVDELISDAKEFSRNRKMWKK